jgi:hypothetical protein
MFARIINRYVRANGKMSEMNQTKDLHLITI